MNFTVNITMFSNDGGTKADDAFTVSTYNINTIVRGSPDYVAQCSNFGRVGITGVKVLFTP